jgi:bifunctional NMN adenylyltransferase/nudix hydrolase
MSTNKEFDYLIFIGRFQPMHIGHLQVINKALELSDNLIVLVGSSYIPSTIKNPWCFGERVAMIASTLSSDLLPRVSIEALEDIMYSDDAWIRQVQEKVASTIFSQEGKSGKFRFSHDLKIGIIGHSKDESSFYLRLFPQWTQVSHEMDEVVHATDIRAILFENKNILYLRGLLPSSVFDQMKNYILTTRFATLQKEYEFIKRYKQSWAAAPYEPTFMTADAVVVQSGHILMVVRDASPGEGLFALPGGFVNTNEYIECAALRELKEETKIDVPAKVLRGNIKQSHVFDHPQRSLRGRTITQAFFIELPPGPLPKVKGSDDARAAMWIPFNELNPQNIFEDHFSIIRYFIG